MIEGVPVCVSVYVYVCMCSCNIEMFNLVHWKHLKLLKNDEPA